MLRATVGAPSARRRAAPGRGRLRSPARRRARWALLALLGALVAAAGTSARLPAAAGGASEPIRIVVAGRLLTPDVPPEVVSGRTMVPVRALAQELGASVTWRPEGRQVEAVREGLAVTLTLGRRTARVGDREVTLDVAPYARAGRTMIPLRFVSEAFGAAVSWEPERRAVFVAQPGAGTPILGAAQLTPEAAQCWARARGAHERFLAIAPAYWHYAALTGIRPEVAYAQAAKETGFGHFGGAVRPEQNNWAGIKKADATGDRPEDHESFPTPEEGVRAHFNHLAAYVGVEPVGEPHGRYYVVRRQPWAGLIRHVEELGGRWAPNPDYGKDLVERYLEDLLVRGGC